LHIHLPDRRQSNIDKGQRAGVASKYETMLYAKNAADSLLGGSMRKDSIIVISAYAIAEMVLVSVGSLGVPFTYSDPKDGACLTVTQAHRMFCELSERRRLGILKRSMFKEMMQDLVREKFNLALRHDVPDSQNKHQQAWRGLRLVNFEGLVA
jgi:hypothetical protein